MRLNYFFSSSSFSFIADNQKLQESGTDEDTRSGNSHLEMAAPDL